MTNKITKGHKRKLIPEKERYKRYREIYVLLRKLNLKPEFVRTNLHYIILDINQTWGTNDNLNKVDTSWYRCSECNGILKIKDKINNIRYCVHKSCPMYHKEVDNGKT